MTDTTTGALYKRDDRVALAVRLSDDHGDFIALPGDVGVVEHIVSDDDPQLDRGGLPGPFYAVHFDHIPHANLEYVAQCELTWAGKDLWEESDLTAGTSWIHVYYLGCGHVGWLVLPPQDPPRVHLCRSCDREVVVVCWEGKQVSDGPAFTTDTPGPADGNFAAFADQLALVGDLPGDMPWAEARKILDERIKKS